ncbi:MAG: type II toxin-antitoxin system Phd/YefM family antitoxin [Deltaproteobacteria bacterium]|nr:type II toxin-antitoxin system Phd/YefM family antitoxin [Deltaproteobacteria bacterium]MBW1924722.1 type II toxin-antitoxin system Phd/YefM family antitoxin [Deltaproteobacteria bacterium]MBW1950841.1 type II toxin-antitoxin system Phd/YefM family antitoxin [Deltaproteobacteria bacterium]MBW2009571.1 type II toxin-antitoxin system Phd/YefM family antitoxin [Deltaproteobacteria bacterium]MBW2103460.1 type II toxin-antitoxin system Phd/YefM family antitoxin [Deltaproteobacteria bacterium]
MAKIKIEDLESIPATRAKVIFGEILHQTSVEGKKYLVDRHGKPISVIISYKEYLRLLEQAERGQDPD